MTSLEWMLHKLQHLKSKSKTVREEKQQFEDKVKILQKKVYKKENNPQLENDSMILRAEYDKLNSFRTTSSRLRLNQSFCDQGDKSGELLARQVKQLETKTSSTSIISNDQATVNPIKMMLLESWTKKKRLI